MQSNIAENNHKIEIEVSFITNFIVEMGKEIDNLNERLLNFRQDFYSRYNAQVLKFKNLDELRQINRKWSKQELLENVDIKCFFPDITDQEIEQWLNQPENLTWDQLKNLKWEISSEGEILTENPEHIPYIQRLLDCRGDITGKFERFYKEMTGHDLPVEPSNPYLDNIPKAKIKDLNELQAIFFNNTKQEIIENVDIKAIFPRITDEEIAAWVKEPD